MAPEGTDAEVRALQAALAEVEEVFRLEQRGLEETNETLLRVQQERSSWQQRVGELQRLLQQQEAALDADAQQAKWKAAVCAAEQQRLNELNEKVRELRERLAKQPQAHQVVEEAVAKVECDTQQRRHSQQLQWEAKQQEMNQKLEAAEARLAFLEEQKAQCLKELLKWRRRMALLRIGRAGSSWKLQRRNELEQQQLDFQLLRLRKRLSRKQGHLDEEVALKAMGLKKELDKEAASNDLRQEERQEELEQLEEEVDALKERTAKAKELLRQHTQLNQALGHGRRFCHTEVSSNGGTPNHSRDRLSVETCGFGGTPPFSETGCHVAKNDDGAPLPQVFVLHARRRSEFVGFRRPVPSASRKRQSTREDTTSRPPLADHHDSRAS